MACVVRDHWDGVALSVHGGRAVGGCRGHVGAMVGLAIGRCRGRAIGGLGLHHDGLWRRWYEPALPSLFLTSAKSSFTSDAFPASKATAAAVSSSTSTTESFALTDAPEATAKAASSQALADGAVGHDRRPLGIVAAAGFAIVCRDLVVNVVRVVFSSTLAFLVLVGDWRERGRE